ncbi:PKD-like family lipoprotein [Bacteroides faecalis]|nr:PKD-like family lipoprotein [Bacteroides faecalis]
MKKLIVYIMLLACWACVDDTTNESFHTLNDVIIEGIEDEYTDVYVDNLFSIHPTLKTTLNTEADLRFFWIAYDKSTRYDADTLSKEKNLDVVIRLTPGEHTMKFKAVSTVTKIYYEKEFTVNVVNEFTNGLMILAETDGKAVLDFWIPGKDEVVTDVYGKLNDGDVLGTHPKRIYFNKYTTDVTSEVLVMCQDGEGGKVLDNITLTKRRDYKDMFFGIVPDEIVPQAYYKSSMREYLIDNGLAYDRATNTQVPSTTVKPSLSVQGSTYEIADNANFIDDEDMVSRMVLYDNQNTCFYSIFNITTAFLTKVTKTSGFTYVNGGFFNPDQVGMKCLYAGITSRSSSGDKEYLGVFETPEGERHLLKMGIGFYTDGTPSSYFKDLGNEVLTCENIATANSFTASALFSGYLFYVAGSKVYVYNSASSTGGVIYDLQDDAEGGAQYVIDHIEVERGGNRLWVAFRDNSLSEKRAGFCGLTVNTDGGLSLKRTVFHPNFADRIMDFESKY